MCFSFSAFFLSIWDSFNPSWRTDITLVSYIFCTWLKDLTVINGRNEAPWKIWWYHSCLYCRAPRLQQGYKCFILMTSAPRRGKQKENYGRNVLTLLLLCLRFVILFKCIITFTWFFTWKGFYEKFNAANHWKVTAKE